MRDSMEEARIGLCISEALPHPNHQKFLVPIMEVLHLISYKAVLGVGFPLQKPYIQLT